MADDSMSGLAGTLAQVPAERATEIADALTSREWNELTDEVLRRLERRVVDDLQRRGRRWGTRVM